MDFHETVDSFDDDDLSLVAPHRRAEVRRRLMAVRRYDAKPTRTEGEAIAAELGISLDTLYVLVRTWRRTGRADALLGAGSPKKRRNELSSEQIAIIKNAIAEGRDDDVETIVDRVAEAAVRQGIEMFGRQVLRKHVRQALGPHVPSDSFAYGSRYAIDHTAVNLPVLFRDRTVAMPIVTTLIDLAKPAVLALNIHPHHPDMAATAWTVVAGLKDGFPKVGDALAYERFPGSDWDRLGNAMRDLGIDLRVAERRKAGRTSLAIHVLGDRYRGIWIKPRATLRSASDRVSTTLPDNVAIESDDAEAILRERWVEKPTDFRVRTAREAAVINRLRELPVNRYLYT